MENKYIKSRVLKDGFVNILTGIASVISVIILFSILIFVFSQGLKNFNLKMLVSDYYETPYFIKFDSDNSYYFEKENSNDIFYSNKYGIGLSNCLDLEGNDCIKITYIDDFSPIKKAIDINNSDSVKIDVGYIVKRVQIKSGSETVIATAKLKAEKIAEMLDDGDYIVEMYVATLGGGIRGSLITTIILIVSTLIIALPIGVIAALYLSNYSKENKLLHILRSFIDMISGIPSIIFGLIAVIIFIPFVSGISGMSGGSILSGALTMTIMLLPTIIKTTEESIAEIPKGYKLSSLALGASETQTTFKVILPNAIPGILTATILSIGRIIGESAALIFAIGTAIQDKVSLFGSSTTLSVHIWSVMNGKDPNYEMACAISIIILVVVLLLNLSIKIICKRLNKFNGSK